ERSPRSTALPSRRHAARGPGARSGLRSGPRRHPPRADSAAEPGPQLERPVEDLLGDLSLAEDREPPRRPGLDQGHAIRVASDRLAGRVEDDQVDALLLQLGAGAPEALLGLEREADQHLALAAHRGKPSED